jgi:acetamidase/formamidase
MTVEILQSGSGPVPGGSFLPSRADEIRWGRLPTAGSAAVLTIASGETVTIDTVSHEGILEDQGRDPVAYLAQFGVGRDRVLDDAVDIAASGLPHPAEDGPHVVTGPVAVRGARPGDVLRIEVLDLALRAPYGFISNRHGRGALPGEMPADPHSLATRDVDTIVTGGTVSHFAWVEERAGSRVGVIHAGGGRTLAFPLAPFLGLMAVATPGADAHHSVPPGRFGGNIDVKHAVVGSTLYLPVLADEALFSTGDPHFAQGNGEVALTAFEAPLRATLRLTTLTGAEARTAVGGLDEPVLETATHWIPTGMDVSLDVAMRNAARNAVDFLAARFDLPRSVALAYLSAAGDFEVSQVVDQVKGVHCMIRKADFAAWH